jgi:hypothetical protein
VGKIRVADGTLVDPYAPTVADVKLDVFAHSLAQLARFTGHAKFPFSVGQHTINLCDTMGRIFTNRQTTTRYHVKRAALSHDMSEVWFNDLSSPVKKENPDYREAEHQAGLFIAHVLKVPTDALMLLDPYDKRMYKNERTALFPVIDGEGMGDNYIPISDDYIGSHAFIEMNWRSVRASLWSHYEYYFPEHTDFVPFWRRKEFILG